MDTELEASPFSAGRYGAIDIGTVTCRLLVADVDDRGKVSDVYRDAVICNLGVGVDETRRLTAEAIERVGMTIEKFNDALGDARLEGGDSIPVKAVATSASRDAENADEFKERLAKAGLELQVIPGQREAALSFAGAASAFLGERVVVLDVGGGSTEVIAGVAGDEPLYARSFNVGCRRVTERCFHEDPPTEESLSRAADWIDTEFRAYLGALKEEGCFDGRIIAVAGTATSIVSIREKMVEYDSSRVHGSTVTRADLDSLLNHLASMSLDERRCVVGLDPGRAPVIVAGLLILQRIMELSGVREFTVSESDILQGIVLSIASE